MRGLEFGLDDGAGVLPGVVSCLAGIPAGAHSPGSALGRWEVGSDIILRLMRVTDPELLTKTWAKFREKPPRPIFGGPGFVVLGSWVGPS